MALAHLGQVVSINNSILLLLADATRAVRWQGTTNGPMELEPEGSDWEKALQAMHPSTDEERNATKAGAFEGSDGRLFVPVRGADTEVAALCLSDSGPGRVDVFACDGRLLLVEGYYDDRDADTFRQAMASAVSDALHVGVVALPSGKLACFPAPSRGAPFADVILAPEDASAEVDLDDESGLLVRLPAGDYDVLREPLSGPWGEATRALLVRR